MQTYLILFINLITFHLLSYIEFNLLIEKLNVMGLLTVAYFYIFAIYNKKVLSTTYNIHPSSLPILIGLMTYNYVLSNNILLTLSIFLFLLFFILDNIYNSINTKTEKIDEPKKQNWEDVHYSYEQSQESKEEKYKKEQKQKQSFEDDLNNFINMQLEGSLVLLGLSHEYTLKQLKKAYRKAAQLNHPDKFPDMQKEVQTIVMKDINEAKSYLEDRLKQYN